MNFNKKEVNYHEFSKFLQERFIGKPHFLLGSIAANMLVFYESCALYNRVDYNITMRKMEKLLPIGTDNLIAAFNFLKSENLIGSAPKTVNGENEIIYFPTELFYNHKNDYIHLFEPPEIIENWNFWFKDYMVKNDIIKEFSEYILMRLEKRPAEISHLQNLIYNEILTLIEEKNPNKIKSMKEKLYVMIDEYARRR